MYPQCIGQCCDARAKQERALFYFIVKREVGAPHTYNALSDRSVQYRFGSFIFPFPKSDHQFCGVRRALYIVYHYHPRDCPAPLFKCLAHTSCTPSSKYNGQGFPHARGPLECTKRARSPTPPPRPVRLEPDRSARTYTYDAAAHARTRVTGTARANNAEKYKTDSRRDTMAALTAHSHTGILL